MDFKHGTNNLLRGFVWEMYPPCIFKVYNNFKFNHCKASIFVNSHLVNIKCFNEEKFI